MFGRRAGCSFTLNTRTNAGVGRGHNEMEGQTMRQFETATDSIASLVAITRAAHLTGDRGLERVARRKLREVWGVDISIRPRSVAK